MADKATPVDQVRGLSCCHKAVVTWTDRSRPEGTPDDSVKRAFHHTTHFTEGISVMKCAAQCQE